MLYTGILVLMAVASDVLWPAWCRPEGKGRDKNNRQYRAGLSAVIPSSMGLLSVASV